MAVTCPPFSDCRPTTEPYNCLSFGPMKQSMSTTSPPSIQPLPAQPIPNQAVQVTQECPKPVPKVMTTMVETEEMKVTEPACLPPASNVCPQLCQSNAPDTSVAILKPAKIYYSQSPQEDVSNRLKQRRFSQEQVHPSLQQQVVKSPPQPQPQLNYSIGTDSCRQRPQQLPPSQSLVSNHDATNSKEETTPAAYYYETVSSPLPDKRHHSYFVDVSPIAEREQYVATPTQDMVCGLDKNIIFQICLLAAASVAASKIFLE